MDHAGWREALSTLDAAPGVEELCEELTRYEWVYRGRWGTAGLRFWPDGGRSQQIVVQANFPVNEHRLEEIRVQINRPTRVEKTEGGN